MPNDIVPSPETVVASQFVKFPCEQCGLQCCYSSQLKTHQSSHVDYELRPFSCDLCSRKCNIGICIRNVFTKPSRRNSDFGWAALHNLMHKLSWINTTTHCIIMCEKIQHAVASRSGKRMHCWYTRRHCIKQMKSWRLSSREKSSSSWMPFLEKVLPEINC